MASRINTALAEVRAAHAEREGVSARTDALVAAAMGRSEPGLVARSRIEKVVQACDAVAVAGGERAPTLTRSPFPTEAEEVVA